MGMNVENLFIKSHNQIAVAALVDRCLLQPPAQPQWSLPSSYGPLLKDNTKRKVAVSPSKEGWVALIESKEVADFGMAKSLADGLGTMAVIIQVSEAAGAIGYLSYSDGLVDSFDFDESAVDPLNDARMILHRFGIPFDLMAFRDVVQMTTQGWRMSGMPLGSKDQMNNHEKQ